MSMLAKALKHQVAVAALTKNFTEKKTLVKIDRGSFFILQIKMAG